MIESDSVLDETWEARSESSTRNGLRQELEVRPTRIVAMGGGTGLPMVLKGLARRAAPRLDEPGLDITAVVAMSDDGGSSGRLRRTRGVLPPGDVRNCLVALAEGKGPLSEVFQYRFAGKKGLAGHAVGNLLIAALAELKGDFLEAVRVSGTLLGAKGKVLPSTLAPVELVARMDDATEVVGESNICRARGRIRQVRLSPQAPAPVDGLIQAIRDADFIVLGPGSLYSSLLPNLLVDGVAQTVVMVADASGSINAYTIDPTTLQLRSLPHLTFSAGFSPNAVAMYVADAGVAYAFASTTAGSVSQFQLSAQSDAGTPTTRVRSSSGIMAAAPATRCAARPREA